MIPIIVITPAAGAARAEADETRQEVITIFHAGADGGVGQGDGSVFGNRVPKEDSTLASFLTHIRGCDGPQRAYQPGPTVSWDQSFGQITGRD